MSNRPSGRLIGKASGAGPLGPVVAGGAEHPSMGPGGAAATVSVHQPHVSQSLTPKQ